MRPIDLAIVFFHACAAVVVNAADGPQFKRVPETLSPNGAYVLAWVPHEFEPRGEEPTPKFDETKEVDFADETFDEEHKDGDATNHLVDLATGRIIATLPDFAYWRGLNWVKNRAELEVAWMADERAALAIYNGRWGSEGVVWLTPATGRVVDVDKRLSDGFVRVVRKHEPRIKDYEIRFTAPIITGENLLLVRASGTIPKEDNTANYLLKFKFTGEGEKIRFDLVNSRKLPESTEEYDDDEERVLNKVYSAIQAKLPPKEREALRLEELRWLKTREMITEEGSRRRFTEQRTDALRTLLASVR